MNINRKSTYLFILALLVAGYFMIAPTKAAGLSAEDSKEVSALLSDSKVEAHELELDATTIETFTRSNLSWQTHAAKLNEMRLHINKAGKLLAKLHDARDAGSPWQQKAIDEITPLLKELASNTEAVLDHFTANKDRFQFGSTYQDYLKANSGLARELAALITDYIDYGYHKSEFKRLGEKAVASER